MFRRLAPSLLLLLTAPGCALCSRCFDEAYPNYGGAVPRHDLFCGRVASAFTPEAGASAGTLHSTNGGSSMQNTGSSEMVEPSDGREPEPPSSRQESQPDLPEPEERPPAATALENVLRGN